MEKIKFLERDVNGKRNKILLKEGLTPAVVYNSKTESSNIMLHSSVAKKILREAKSTTIYDVELEDGKTFKVIIKDVDINPVTDELRHISFFEIDEGKEMVFSVPFEIVGISPAVKNNLGVLVMVMDALDVRCKVNDLVPSFKVDISKLEHPGQSIGVDELNIPDTISLMNEDLKHTTVVTITELQEEEIVAPIVTETVEGEVATAEGEPVSVEGTTEEQPAK